MKKTNFFKKFYNNLFNIRTFTNYMREGLGRAILYAFIFSIILGGVQGLGTALMINKSFKETSKHLNEEQYNFELKQGILQMSTNPIKIEEGGTLVYIDTTKMVSDKDSLRSISVHSDLAILILKDGMIYSNQDSEQQIIYKDFYNGTLRNEDIISQINLMSKFITPIALVVSILMYFLDYLLNCLIITAFAMLSNIIMGLRLRFSGVYSLSIYAATLPSILIGIIGFIVPNVYLTQAMMVGTLLYVILIFRNIRKEISENNRIVK